METLGIHLVDLHIIDKEYRNLYSNEINDWRYRYSISLSSK